MFSQARCSDGNLIGPIRTAIELYIFHPTSYIDTGALFKSDSKIKYWNLFFESFSLDGEGKFKIVYHNTFGIQKKSLL